MKLPRCAAVIPKEGLMQVIEQPNSGTPFEDVDDFIDQITRATDDPTHPLNKKLERVLQEEYSGSLFRFAAGVARFVEHKTCNTCLDELTCEQMLREVEAWADKTLGIPTRRNRRLRIVN